MKKLFLHFLLLALLAQSAQAQFRFSGKIAFERKTNLHRLYEDQERFGNRKANIPKFYTIYSELLFNASQSLYRPGKESANENLEWLQPPGAENVVVQQFGTGLIKAEKQVFEQKFLVEDKLPSHRWKIGSEVRTIAGFQCRKAVTIICDSVYVVAFYAEEIPVSGGPEQMGGLPGMILQLAVPRLQTTWTATEVAIAQPTSAELTLPAGKGKKVTYPEMIATLKTGLKDWGQWGHRAIWWATM